MAGHSKWANIKHRKGRQDAARGKLFAKCAKAIEQASLHPGQGPEYPGIDAVVHQADARRLQAEVAGDILA